MEYQENFINISREDLIDQLKEVVNPKRFAHILRVEKKAIELAQYHGLNLEKASVAALLHDYCKDMESNQMLKLAQTYWNHPLLSSGSPLIWHGFAAAAYASKYFKLQDEDILQAVAHHTIGWYEMSALSQVVYMADYIEEGRNFDGIERARELAFSNLYEASVYQMTRTLIYLIEKQVPLFLPSVEIYNCFVGNDKDMRSK